MIVDDFGARKKNFRRRLGHGAGALEREKHRFNLRTPEVQDPRGMRELIPNLANLLELFVKVGGNDTQRIRHNDLAREAA